MSLNHSNFTNSHSPWIYVPFMLTLASIFMQALVGIAGNLLLLWSLRKTVLLQINVRIYLGNISIASVLFCTYCLVWAVKNAVLAPKIWTESRVALHCMLQEIPSIIGLVVQFYSVIGLGLERLYATKVRDQQVVGRLGKILALSLWIWAAVVCAVSLVASSYSRPIYYCALAQLVTADWMLYFVCTTTIAGDAFALGLYYYIFRYNRNTLSVLAVNQAKSTLRSRYQIRRNLELTQMLFPSVLLHSIVHCLVVPTAILIYPQRFEFNPTISLFVNCECMVILMHAVMHPILCFRASHALFRTLRSSVRNMPLVPTVQQSSDLPETETPPQFMPDSHHMTFEEHERILLQAWSGDLCPTRKMSLLSVKSGHELLGIAQSTRKASLLSVRSQLSTHSEKDNPSDSISTD